MAQSYKVFIGGSVLYFGNTSKSETVFNTKLTDPKHSDWPTIIARMEKDANTIMIIGNTELNWQQFMSNYQLIEAGGGMVQNDKGEWLFIHRNEMWDLPKGKLEKGETIEACAVREVAEECGIEEPKIVKPLSPTYHTYVLHDQRILKKTHWYLMQSSDNSKLIPQTEEGISKVAWVSVNEARNLAQQSFGSIKEVIKEGLLINFSID